MKLKVLGGAETDTRPNLKVSTRRKITLSMVETIE
jgi:hypothetical protein